MKWLMGKKDIPEYLYHATYKQLLKSIKEKGLGGEVSPYPWQLVKPGIVYLATEFDIALSYAETNDNVPDEWIDEIVVFKIDTKDLDKNKIKTDTNVKLNKDEEAATIMYEGIIPYNILEKVTE